MKIARFLIISIITALLFTQCLKETDEQEISTEYEYFETDTSMYSLLFDSGSYWVYVNAEETLIDSVSVQGVEEGIYYYYSELEGRYTGEWPIYKIDYTSSIDGDYSEYIYLSVISNDINSGDVLFFRGEAGDIGANSMIIEIHENYEVADSNYTNVTEMDINSIVYLSLDMDLFYADSIGVVKKIFTEGTISVFEETWELLRYDVQLYDAE